jgi:very-short-patch-repair endonuclease
MRWHPTESEQRLFEAIRGGQLGVEFRRQVPVAGRYVVDFLAPEVRLVVEVDGGCHRLRRQADAKRDEVLRRLGYRVLRLQESLVVQDLPIAVERIVAELDWSGR